MPEFVAPQDGAEKQDCERNAVKRWFENHNVRLAPLRPIFLGDDLFACHPVAKMVTDAGDDFIFTCNPTSHKTLYDFIDGAELPRTRRKSAGAIRKRRSVTAGSRPFRCATARTPYWSTGSASKLSTPRAKVKYSMAWVTSLPVSKDNVAEIVACGRARCLSNLIVLESLGTFSQSRRTS